MAELTLPEIVDIIVKNPNKATIEAGRKANKKLRMHFYGENLDMHISCIDGYEKPEGLLVRRKWAKSNRDFCARLAHPINKVFSARGGSIYYNLPEKLEKQARQLASNVRGGASIAKYLETEWRNAYLVDPCGVMFMEIADGKKARQLYEQGKSFVYPTEKSIQNIYDYQATGEQLEYIVFNVDKAEKLKAGLREEDQVFRLVDDAWDYFVQRLGDQVYIRWEHSFRNPFGYVPGIINSDIIDPLVPGGHLSIFADIMDPMDIYLMKGSIKITHEFLFAFPKYWEYADDCKTCNGSGELDAKICPKCKGTKKEIMSLVSDAKVLAHPQTKDDPIITPNVAGFVSPDKVYYEISTHDLALIEDLAKYTLWGATQQQKTQGMASDTSAAGGSGSTKTATEIMTELQPQADRLSPISDCLSKRYKFALDAIVRIQVKFNYEGSLVNAGKRYIIEGPDALLDKYNKAKQAGTNWSTLDDLLNDYFETKYNSDPIMLHIMQKLMRVEPFVHVSLRDAKGLGLSDDEWKIKLYYGEWLSTMNKATIIGTDEQTLRDELMDYCSDIELAPDPLLITAQAGIKKIPGKPAAKKKQKALPA